MTTLSLDTQNKSPYPRGPLLMACASMYAMTELERDLEWLKKNGKVVLLPKSSDIAKEQQVEVPIYSCNQRDIAVKMVYETMRSRW